MQKQKSLTNSDYWQVFRLVTGAARSYADLKGNAIWTRKQTGGLLLLGVLINVLACPSVLCLLASIITISFLPSAGAFPLGLYAAELAIILLMMVGKQVYFDVVRSKADGKINGRRFLSETHVFRQREQLKQRCWGDIQEGDILFLQQGEKVPADILLLDSQQIEHREAITYVDTRAIDGNPQCQKKKSCYLTQISSRNPLKLHWLNYQEIIDGKLTYEKPDGKLDSFTGYLKLSKDPKTEKLTSENLVLRESVIKTGWVYGLVVYAGMDCKIMQHRNDGPRKEKWITHSLDRLFLLCVMFNILLGTTFSLAYCICRDPTTTREVLSAIAYHFLLFSLLLPHLLYFGNAILLLHFSLYNKAEAEIIDYSNISALGSVDFAVIANNGVLNSGRILIDEIVTASSIYEIRTQKEGRKSSTHSSNKHRRRDGSGIRHDSSEIVRLSSQMQSKPIRFLDVVNEHREEQFQIDDENRPQVNGRLGSNSLMGNSKGPNLRTQLQPLIINYAKLRENVESGEEQSIQLLKTFALCNQAKFSYIDEDHFHATSYANEEEVLLKLISSVNWNIRIFRVGYVETGLEVSPDPFDPTKGAVRKREWVRYERRLNSFQVRRKLFSVVVENEEKITLYCKGSADDMIERLRDRQLRKNMIDSRLAGYRNNKAQVLIYGKREMTSLEYELYENDYVNLKSSLGLSEAQVDQFSKKYQDDLEFVCIVALASEESQTAREFVDYLSGEGVKLCVMAHDNSELRLLKNLLHGGRQEAECIELDKSSCEQLRYYLNYVTRKLKNDSDYRFSILLNSASWTLLESYFDLMQHFLFVVYYSQSIVAYDLQPRATAEFTRKLKCGYNHEHTILTIGSSYADLLYQDHSDISLSISADPNCPGDNPWTSSDLLTDIRAQSTAKLKEIIQLGSWFLEISHHIMYATLYRSVSVSMAILVFEISLLTLGSSSGFNGILMLIYVVVYGVLETVYLLLVNRRIQSVQRSDSQLKYIRLNLDLYANLIQAIIHGGVICGTTLLTLPQVRIFGGKLLPAEALHFSVFILLVTVSACRHLLTPKSTKASAVIMVFSSYLVIFAALWLTVLFSPSFFRVAVQPLYLFQCYDSIIMLINTAVFCLCCSLFIHNLSRCEQVLDYLTARKSKTRLTSKNRDKEALMKHKRARTSPAGEKHLDRKLRLGIDMVDLVSHLFKEDQTIEESIREIVADEIDLNELKIDSLLEIRKEESNIKSQFSRCLKNTRRFRVILLFAISLFVAELAFDSSHLNAQKSALLATGVTLVLIVFLLLTLAGDNVSRKYYTVAEGTVAGVCLLLVVYGGLREQSNQQFLLACVLCALVTQLLQIRLLIVLLCVAGITVGNMCVLWILVGISGRTVAELCYALSCAGVNLVLLRSTLIESRTNFLIKEQNEMQTNQINDILNILVPKFVKNHFLPSRSNGEGQEYKEGSVAVLFCYVCNFDSILQEEGTKVVNLMDELFREFDKLCTSFAVQKIETVGYTYMAATGIRKIESEMENEMGKKNKIERLMFMAVQMMEKTKIFRWGLKKNKTLEVKVGIHCGEVMIGVIGEHKKQFSLIGTTVNTTSRHCSTGNNGSITLSEQAYRQLNQHNTNYNFKQEEQMMKGLSKGSFDKIKVYRYLSIASNAKHSSNYKSKFRELVMRVIREARATSENMSEFGNANEDLLIEEEPNEDHLQVENTREASKRRTTSAAIERNFQEIEELNAESTFYLQNYTCMLELRDKPSREQHEADKHYKKYLYKKHRLEDRLIVAGLCIISMSFLAICAGRGNCSILEITLRSGQVLLEVIAFVLAGYSIGRLWICIFMILANIFILLVDKLACWQLSGGTNLFGSLVNPSFTSLSHFSVMLSITVFSGVVGLRFLHMCLVGMSALLVNAVLAGLGSVSINNFYELMYIVCVLVRKYETQKESIINFHQRVKLQEMSEQQSKIVSQLLPKHAYEKLKNQNIETRLQLTDRFTDCTILFADIKGFTEFSNTPENKCNPENVVKMLRTLFESFDRHCVSHNVYKVYTIGDCYVVLGFTNCYERNPVKEADNVIQMGFDMIETIAEVRKDIKFPGLDMRIGVHTGTIIGGIIGTEIVRYDIYGSDVMIANKFEEKGKVAHIHISETTKKLLDQLDYKNYEVKPHGQVTVQKLNATYDGYLIAKSKFGMAREE